MFHIILLKGLFTRGAFFLGTNPTTTHTTTMTTIISWIDNPLPSNELSSAITGSSTFLYYFLRRLPFIFSDNVTDHLPNRLYFVLLPLQWARWFGYRPLSHFQLMLTSEPLVSSAPHIFDIFCNYVDYSRERPTLLGLGQRFGNIEDYQFIVKHSSAEYFLLSCEYFLVNT